MGSLGLPRGLFRANSQPARRRKRAHYQQAVNRFGVLTGLTRDLAIAETELWWVFTEASQELAHVETKRRHGRGRRPNVAAIEKLRRRQGIAFQSWDAALKRLEELAESGRGRGLAHVVQQAHRGVPR